MNTVSPHPKTIRIEPVTRLEGHGKIEHLPRRRGRCRPAPTSRCRNCAASRSSARDGRPKRCRRLTSRICGVCPTAHHMASTKALDAFYAVQPPAAARKIRELVYSAFMVEDHTLHLYFLGGPDFVVGPQRRRPSATCSASSPRSGVRWDCRSSRSAAG